MKYKVYVFLSFCLLFISTHKICAKAIDLYQNSTNLYEVNATIIDSINSERLPFATIKIIAENGNTRFLTTDENGCMKFSVLGGEYCLEISYVGYKKKKECFVVKEKNIDLGYITMQQDIYKTKEVVITERKRLIKLTNSGIEYDISKDASVQSTNLLSAMRNVPLVNIDGNGKIYVKGSNEYSIYRNGKPYRIAQSNPKEVLQSIPASTISKIEIITNPDAKYDGEDGSSIINIITSYTFLDGYSLTVNGAAESKPKGNAGISFIGGIHNVILSAGYDYSVDTQNDQPIESYQDYLKSNRLTQSVKMDGNGDGKWQNHMFRAMLNWEIDSLNSIYVDGHGLLKNTNHTTEWHEILSMPSANEEYSLFNTRNSCWSGTAETNIIYRNLYKDSKNERFTLGYRYTYNPDRRNYSTRSANYQNFTGWNDNSSVTSQNRSKNNGGLSEHTFLGDVLFEINKNNLLKAGIKQIFRTGNSNPEYFNWDFPSGSWTRPSEQEDIMHYTQNVSGVYASYSTSLKQIQLSIGVRGEYSWMNMKFPNARNYNFSSNQFDLLPRGSISYQFPNQAQLKLSYSARLRKPTITMLSPFTYNSSNYSISYGNPFLKNEYIHNISLNYMAFTNQLTLFGGIDYIHTNNTILGYNSKMNDADIAAYTYGNIGKVTKAGGNLYINYRPIKTLSLTASYNASYYGINSDEYELKQNSITYNLFLMCNLNFKKRWNIGGNYGLFKQIPQPWGHYNPFSIYSIYASKGFLDGKLNVGIVINSPFSKYTKLTSFLNRLDFLQKQVNYMTARSFGINISYTLRNKKQVKLNRERRIQNDDLETGVK